MGRAFATVVLRRPHARCYSASALLRDGATARKRAGVEHEHVLTAKIKCDPLERLFEGGGVRNIADQSERHAFGADNVARRRRSLLRNRIDISAAREPQRVCIAHAALASMPTFRAMSWRSCGNTTCRGRSCSASGDGPNVQDRRALSSSSVVPISSMRSHGFACRCAERQVAMIHQRLRMADYQAVIVPRRHAVALAAPLRRSEWSLLKDIVKGSVFPLSLVVCASMMPVGNWCASWETAFGCQSRWQPHVPHKTERPLPLSGATQPQRRSTATNAAADPYC